MNAALPPSLSRPASYFPALTGVRALAAYLVFGHHVSLTLRGIAPAIISLLQAGHAGVTVFFVLSGFLISFKYEESLRQKHLTTATYFLRRLARIFPLYLLLTILVLLWKRDFDPGHWLLNITLLKGFFAAEKFTGIAQAWSLTVEESFYITAPLLFLFLRKFSWFYVLLFLSAGFLLTAGSRFWPGSSFMKGQEFMMEFTFFGRAFEFYCGYLLARIQKNRPSHLNAWPLFTAAGSLLFLAGFTLIAWLEHTKFEFSNSLPAAIIFNNFGLPLAIGLLFFGLLNERTLLSRFLGSGPMQILGKSSYAFYLIHAGMVFEILFFHFFQNRWLIFLAMNIISIGLFFGFEKPVESFLRRKIERRQ